MTPNQRIEEIRAILKETGPHMYGYSFRDEANDLLTQLDAAKKLAEKRLEALRHSVECSGTAWSQVQQSLVDCLKCAEAKRLVDQHGD